MKRVLALAIFVLMLLSLCSMSMAAGEKEIFTVYVGDIGNDETNDGLSPEKPVATFAKACHKVMGPDVMISVSEC